MYIMPYFDPTDDSILDFSSEPSIWSQNRVSDFDPSPAYYSFLKAFLNFITLKTEPSLWTRTAASTMV